MAKHTPRRKKEDPELQKGEQARLIPKAGQLIVRMYRQGLGDCFLLAFLGKQNKVCYMLIDCGVHKRQPDGPQRLQEVLNDIVAATGGHLDVVVATHEHADHLSGFVQKGSPFLTGKLTVGELWVAWTEKVGDQEADALRRKRGTARAVIEKAVKEASQRNDSGLAETIDRLNDFEYPDDNSIDWNEIRERINKLWKASPECEAVPPHMTQFLNGQADEGGEGLGIAAKKAKNPTSNELALALLTALAEHVEYVSPGKVLDLPGAGKGRCFVLGPPRDPQFLEKDRPTKIGKRSSGDGEGSTDGQYKEVYLSGKGGGRAFQLSPALDEGNSPLDLPAGVPVDIRFPFDGFHRRRFKSAGTDKPDEQSGLEWEAGPEAIPDATRELFDDHYTKAQSAWRRIDANWLGTAETLALNLGSDTNNTSLVLALEWGEQGEGQVLLFPGDAQVGNWLSWRQQPYKVGRRTVTADDLLKRTVLYKVGHHASHNGTVRRDPGEVTDEYPLGVPFGLELMDDIIALIPVNREAAERKTPISWDMPYTPLYKKLRDKARRRVLRSDDTMSPLTATDKDLVPTKTTWSASPGLRGVQWRMAGATFSAAPRSALYYDIVFRGAES